MIAVSYIDPGNYATDVRPRANTLLLTQKDGFVLTLYLRSLRERNIDFIISSSSYSPMSLQSSCNRYASSSVV